MRFTRCMQALTILMAISWQLLVQISPGRAEITAEEVRNSIRRGVLYLKSQQRVDGHWDDHAGQRGGVTALCTLALLSAGVEADDPVMQNAMKYLRLMGNPEATYSTSLQTMVFCAVQPELDRISIRKNIAWLEEAQSANGGWGYQLRSEGPDESNTQFAVLALHEAERAGVPVSRETWRKATTYWVKDQKPDGSWGYRGQVSSGSMTCAGIASLMIASQHIERGDAWVIDGNVLCCGKKAIHPEIDKGLAWLGRNFSVARNPSSDNNINHSWVLYYLYALERVGRIGGERFIGDHDWYREGAEAIVQRQDRFRGTWSELSSFQRADISTALALLFLSKGRWPVLVSKLRFGDEDQWNRHRNDLAHLTRHVETRWKQELTWQTIDATKASVEDLLQTPVLFISGKEDLRLSPDVKQRLREYVNQGGFIFAEACCNSKVFDAQFRALMKELFPDNPLRLLPPDHPVWYAEQAVEPNQIRPLYGLDSCCRTSVVYCPENLGCFWELARSRGMQYPANVQTEVDNVLAIGANVLAYATGRELRDKLDMPLAMPSDTEESTFERATLQIGKLEHTGGSDEAPAALVNLLRIVHEQLDFPVRIERQLVNASDKTLPDFPLLFIHGRREFTFSEEERAGLRDYLRNGGFLFGDSICASRQFVEAFKRELQLVLPGATFKRIPADHPLFTSEYRGFTVPSVRLRVPGSRQANEPLAADVKSVPPILEGLQYEGRYVVVFSPVDMSCALENHSSMDCEGYVRDDAARLGLNIILFGLQQ